MAGTGHHTTIISREQWGARSPKQDGEAMPGPAKFVFIHHSAGETATDPQACREQVKVFQDYHMDEKKWDDIGYSFVVGEDGNAYEGRGWTVVGAHTRGYNREAIGICIIGNFNSRDPNSNALRAAQELIEQGVEQGHIVAGYTLKGHKDVGSTDCPGDCLYEIIQCWPRYASKDNVFQ